MNAIARSLLGLLLALPLALPAAHATDWTADLTQSRLGFSGVSQGEAFDGQFTRFTPTIRFDPAALDDSRFDVSIDLDSADTRNAERDEMLADPAFFGAGQQAHYRADSFVALGGERFRADGVLTLNGVERPVALTFTFSRSDGSATLDGDAALQRLAFSVGSGEWADTDAIAADVDVHTHLALQAAAQ